MKKINLSKLLNNFHPVIIVKKMDPEKFIAQIIRDQKKLIIASAVILIILGVDLLFVLQPQMRKLAELKPKIVKLKNELDTLNLNSKRMQRGRGVDTGEKLKELLSPGQIPWIIKEISQLASKQHVTISQIKPLQKTSVAKTNNVQHDILVWIDLDMSAGYHELGNFLTDLENHPILLQVEELKIKRDNENLYKHDVALILRTFISNS